VIAETQNAKAVSFKEQNGIEAKKNKNHLFFRENGSIILP
jgi:hypothetical protein